jgi:hypothetical protein
MISKPSSPITSSPHRQEVGSTQKIAQGQHTQPHGTGATDKPRSEHVVEQITEKANNASKKVTERKHHKNPGAVRDLFDIKQNVMQQ